jgi:hypothetical protein
MTGPASQRSTIRSRWGQCLRTCPIWPVLWTRRCDVSIAWTYFRDVSLATSSLGMFRLAVALREQMAQASKLDRLIWANLEEIGYDR